MGSEIDRLATEMAGADLGDARLSWRLGKIAGALLARPGKSLPKALGTEAALEATYRFMSNESVIPEAVLAPHIAATCDRVAASKVTLALHDTTEAGFDGTCRVGMTRLSKNRQGFFAHVCLAVDEGGQPLGILGLHHWNRDESTQGARRRTDYGYEGAKESDRWANVARHVDELTEERARVVHVMDREADSYRLLVSMVERDAEFVVRAAHHERRLADGRSLEATVDDAEVRLIREVNLTKRPPLPTHQAPRRTNPERKARKATLLISTMSIKMKGSWSNPVDAEQIDLNVVRAWEPEPPDGEHPIEWVLLTNLPIDTDADVEFIIEAYRRRWIIEELFKALKTGCGFEKLQLESGTALANALAIMLPVAVSLLRLRWAAREATDTPVTEVLNELQVRLLLAHENTASMPLATARDALLAVARLGGHIKNNGDPGWQVLGRGYEDLLTMERGARMAWKM